MGYLSIDQLNDIGFKAIGSNIKISEFARIYNPQNISIGNNVRIDDFAILSAGEGGITLGDYVHISSFCGLIGAEEIVMESFAGLSSRVFIYSSSDDYSGQSLTNPTVPDAYTDVESAPVRIGKHVILGSCATVLPGVTIGSSTAIGAYSLVNNDIPEGVIAVGQPCHEIRKRSLKHLELEKELLNRS